MGVNGTFSLERSENLESFLKGIGVKDETVAKIAAVTNQTVTLNLSGDKFEIESKGKETTNNTLLLNKPSAFTFAGGFEIEVTVSFAGNIGKGALKKGDKTGQVTFEVTDSCLIETFEICGNTCKRFYKRV